MPGHSRRYCAPEVARAVLRRDEGGAADIRVEPSMDLWATGLVLYELFVGVPRFGEAVSYKELAQSGNIALPREATDELIGEAHGRLLSAVLLRDPEKRPSAQYMLDKNVFKRADDTQERKRIEIVAFFSNPRGAGAELNLMREIQELFDAAQWGKRFPLVRPAARLSDISNLLALPLVRAVHTLRHFRCSFWLGRTSNRNTYFIQCRFCQCSVLPGPSARAS